MFIIQRKSFELIVSFFSKDYVARNSLIQQPGQIQNQQSIQCQQAMIMPPPSASPCVQQMSCGQVIQRPLSIGGTGGVQAILASPQQQQICM